MWCYLEQDLRTVELIFSLISLIISLRNGRVCLAATDGHVPHVRRVYTNVCCEILGPIRITDIVHTTI